MFAVLDIRAARPRICIKCSHLFCTQCKILESDCKRNMLKYLFLFVFYFTHPKTQTAILPSLDKDSLYLKNLDIRLEYESADSQDVALKIPYLFNLTGRKKSNTRVDTYQRKIRQGRNTKVILS